MDKYFKIGFVFLFSCVALYSNTWAITLGIALLFTSVGTLFSIYYFAITIPIIYLLISYVGQSYIGIFIGVAGIYAFRSVIGDITYNHNYYLSSFWGIIYFGTIQYMPFVAPIPLILMSSTLPSVNIKFLCRKIRLLLFLIVISFSISAVYIIYGYNSTKKRAYLQQGVWAKPYPEYNINNMNNSSCYSYSEFVTLLNADIIIDLQPINNYNELWIVTPTKPFTKTQLSTIKDWVSKGGNLIVVSDHTDLYGHARCTNQLASLFGCKIHNSATFDKNNSCIFKDAYASPINIKTGTNMTGSVFPLVTSWLWEEEAYYANSNFFGPLAASGDDSFGNKIVAGQTVYGFGQICFLQDSTIFANFAVYQPYVLNLADLISRHSFIAKLYFLIPFLFAFCLWIFASGYKRIFSYMFVFTPFVLPISDCPSFNYGKNPQIWTGNYKFVMENGCPYTNISTAYSQAALSERKPYWKEFVKEDEKDVIWVDSIKPPYSEWRWIKVQDIHMQRTSSTSSLEPLYSYLKAPYVKSWIDINTNYQELSVNSLFSDVVMNDWWYNDGITTSRFNRIKAWIAWLNKSNYNINTQPILFSNNTHKAIVHAKGYDKIILKLPKPLGKNGNEVYIGNGLSGIIYVHGDTLSIFGKKQYSENINCPDVWTVDYID